MTRRAQSFKFSHSFFLCIWYFVSFLADSLNFYPDSAKALPMPNVTLKKQQPLVDLVIRRLNGEPVDTKIDKLVYELYGLTPEEIAIIEGTEPPS
jgi:hypothetical protein